MGLAFRNPISFRQIRSAMRVPISDCTRFLARHSDAVASGQQLLHTSAATLPQVADTRRGALRNCVLLSRPLPLGEGRGEGLTAEHIPLSFSSSRSMPSLPSPIGE